MGHDHGMRTWSASAGQGTAIRRRLSLVLGITFILMLVEVAGGLLTGSLALLADAGHMLSDVGALGFALFAAWFAARPSPPRNTFGYQRIEILAAQVNAVLLSIVLFYIVREAVLRIGEPRSIDVGPMALIGGLGLAGNLVSALLLHQHAHANLNVRGAYLEVTTDLLASVGVLVAAALTHFFGWRHADAVISLAIAAFIVPRIWFLLREVTDVLMESAPRGLDLEGLRVAMTQQPGVVAVHDLHVWAITPTHICLSAHLVSSEGADRDGLLVAVNRMLRERYGVGHTTLQVEGSPPLEAGSSVEPPCDPCETAPVEVASPRSRETADPLPGPGVRKP